MNFAAHGICNQADFLLGVALSDPEANREESAVCIRRQSRENVARLHLGRRTGRPSGEGHDVLKANDKGLSINTRE